MFVFGFENLRECALSFQNLQRNLHELKRGAGLRPAGFWKFWQAGRPRYFSQIATD
jgi:hypothetical protein